MGSSTGEAVVRRFYEEMCNGRHNEIAAEIFTSDHAMYDPQVPAAPGPQGMVDSISVYQNGVDGHWQIEELISADDRVIARWTGTGTHIGEISGLAPTGRKIKVDAISIHRIRDGKIAETREVWDTLTFLAQLGAMPGERSELIKSGYEAFARQDVPAVLALFDENMVWTAPDTIKFGGTYNGPNQVGEFFSHLPELYAELHVQPQEFVEQGDRVIVLGTHSGKTHAGTGFEAPFVHCWTVKNGRATAFTEFFDTVHMNAALGIPSAVELAAAAAGVPAQVNLTDQPAQANR
jgi:ketosteroid isomerase-like protein